MMPWENEMETLNYNDKFFVGLSNTKNGEVNEETTFHYHQMDEYINNTKTIRTGKCESIPEITKDGRIKLREKWKWTNGDKSKGESTVIEKYVNNYLISVRIENMDSLLNIKINKTYLCPVYFFPPVSVLFSPRCLSRRDAVHTFPFICIWSPEHLQEGK
jgi:hypothetical protein